MTATTFIFIRHAAHALVERVLIGRMPDVRLGNHGCAQAAALAERLSRSALDRVQTSPQDRARETAAPIAERAGVSLEIAPALDEIDVGEWTGRSFEDLAGEAHWQQWNSARSIARAPGGESMFEVQARVVDHVHALRSAHPEGRVALVSHLDVIRAAILYFLGLPLDAYARIEIAPAGITTLVVGDWGAKLHALNETAPA